MKNKRSERLGATKFNSHGTKITVIKYDNTNNITVRFSDGYTTATTWPIFEHGILESPCDKTVYGIGYIGIGKYTIGKKHSTDFKRYVSWHIMMQKCYDEKFHEKFPKYKGNIVCEKWHNFQTYAKWYDENYYNIDNEKMCLTKNIIIPDNNIYSPDKCIFLPRTIRDIFMGRDKRLKEYVHNTTNEYYIKYIDSAKNRYMGKDTLCYITKIYKDKDRPSLKKFLEKYKNKLPQKVYRILMNC